MLRVEIDIFSGRPNPVWIIPGGTQADKLLHAVADVEGATSKLGAGFSGLGFREVRVSLISDDMERPKGVPMQFALASTACPNFEASGQLARRLIETMPLRSQIRLIEHEITPLNAKLRDLVFEQLARYLSDPRRLDLIKPVLPRSSLRTTIKDENCPDCHYEVSKFNPGFWNTPAVQPHNNCYNYARNWRTDTFAQPGRAHGGQASKMACGNVTAAAMADGLRKRCDCFPDPEYPRRLMALVVWPSWDYHWYRHQRGGFWGHKPGQTAARNLDDSNNLILNPEKCDRGPYTDFCDYFYAGLSVVIN